MGNKKKLKGFIQDDRPLKLKSYVMSHKLCLNDINLGRRRNLLHYCAHCGTADMIRCLMKLKCDPSQQDKYGNLPLHLALQRGLDEDIKQAREILSEMVPVLLDAYPLGQDVENREGATGYDLLTSLKKKIKSASIAQKGVTEAIEKQELEDLWMQKLNQEAMYEYEEGISRYSCSDDIQQEESKHPDDDWFESVRCERDNKHQREHYTFVSSRKRKLENNANNESNSKKPYKQHETDDDKLRKAREEMKNRFHPTPTANSLDRLLSKKQRYESKFTHLLNHLSGQTLTFACIPWPSVDLNSVVNVLFCDLSDRQSIMFKKYLRTQQIRWHPDRFTQKFGDHLHPDHVLKVMGRVKAISQVLNQLRTSITSN